MNQLLGNVNKFYERSYPVNHEIKVNVVVNLQSDNLNLELSIDPEIPFSVFIRGITELIFAQRMQAQYEETLEYQLGNGLNLYQNENRTLQQLGFTNNCTLYVRLKLLEYKEPTINIICQYREFKIKLKLPFDSTKIFCVFLEQILSEHIFDDEIPIEFQNNIECKLEERIPIRQNETKSLQKLGFTKNCILNIKLNSVEQESSINIICTYKKLKIKLKLPFHPEMSFAVFLQQIQFEQIFENELPSEYKNNIEYQLEKGRKINQNETKSLDALGFTKNCTLNIKLSNREDEILILQQKRIFEVLVDLQFKKIELNISQYKNTPVSCVFNDILMELIESQQFSASQLLAFFINDKEIDPFDCRLLEDFYILKSIKLKKIPSNKQPNQYANEKNQFALKNKSKWQRLNLEEKIKIECVDDNIEILALINHSLEDITKQIISDLSISKKYQNYSVKYQINGEELQDIYSIYSKTDIQIKIQYPEQQNVLNPQLIFQFTGDFYQKILISGQINSKNFIIEESLEINGSYDQLLEYLKFKIFGPQEKQYSQDILDIKSRFIKVNYIKKNR